MSAIWKTVGVFISSTFHDMRAERDHLVCFVFPKLWWNMNVSATRYRCRCFPD